MEAIYTWRSWGLQRSDKGMNGLVLGVENRTRCVHIFLLWSVSWSWHVALVQLLGAGSGRIFSFPCWHISPVLSLFCQGMWTRLNHVKRDQQRFYGTVLSMDAPQTFVQVLWYSTIENRFVASWVCLFYFNSKLIHSDTGMALCWSF